MSQSSEKTFLQCNFRGLVVSENTMKAITLAGFQDICELSGRAAKDLAALGICENNGDELFEISAHLVLFCNLPGIWFPIRGVQNVEEGDQERFMREWQYYRDNYTQEIKLKYDKRLPDKIFKIEVPLAFAQNPAHRASDLPSWQEEIEEEVNGTWGEETPSDNDLVRIERGEVSWDIDEEDQEKDPLDDEENLVPIEDLEAEDAEDEEDEQSWHELEELVPSGLFEKIEDENSSQEEDEMEEKKDDSQNVGSTENEEAPEGMSPNPEHKDLGENVLEKLKDLFGPDFKLREVYDHMQTLEGFNDVTKPFGRSAGGAVKNLKNVFRLAGFETLPSKHSLILANRHISPDGEPIRRGRKKKIIEDKTILPEVDGAEGEDRLTQIVSARMKPFEDELRVLIDNLSSPLAYQIAGIFCPLFARASCDQAARLLEYLRAQVPLLANIMGIKLED